MINIDVLKAQLSADCKIILLTQSKIITGIIDLECNSIRMENNKLADFKHNNIIIKDASVNDGSEKVKILEWMVLSVDQIIGYGFPTRKNPGVYS